MKVSGVTITDEQLAEVEAALAGQAFELATFQQALERAKVPAEVSYQAAKRHLQELRRDGAVVFDRDAGIWKFPEFSQEHERQTQDSGIFAFFGRSVVLVTCAGSIGALIAINASFAWELAETRFLKVALVVALMSCDLLRPFLVAQGFRNFGNSRIFPAILAVLLAFLLSPLSVLSSTSAIFASLAVGESEQISAELDAENRTMIQERYEFLQSQSAGLWVQHDLECERGGCGSRAVAIAADAKAIDEEAQALLESLIQPAGQAKSTSFALRSLEAFEALGLYAENRRFLLPLAIALTLELAALFGPAILLTRRRGA